MAFAKIFESEKYGQLLMKKDMDDEGKPELRLYFQPPNGGVCSLAFGYQDNDEGWDLRDKGFEKADLAMCEGAMKQVPPDVFGLFKGA